MDALDELLRPFLSDHPNARRNRWVVVVGLASAVVTAALWSTYIEPIDTGAYQGLNSPDYWALLFFLPLLAPIATFLAVRRHASWWRYAVGASIAPLIMVWAAWALREERSEQRRALDVFAAYTHRFPDGRLRDPTVVDGGEEYLTVCADEGSSGLKRFCVDIELRAPRGEQVMGGYRLDDRNQEAYGPTDCFGETLRCGEADEP
jgi:hypothetical protein